MKRNPLVSIVIPTKNQVGIATSCVKAAVREAARDGNTEVVVVDHGSTDGLLDILNTISQIQLVHGDANYVGGQRNLAVMRAQGELLYFLDSDVELAFGALARVREFSALYPSSVIGSFYSLPSDATYVETAWHKMAVERPDGIVSYLNGGNMIVPRRVFDTVGGFSDTMQSGEDVDFCTRVRHAGYNVVQIRELAAMHHGNAKKLMSFFRKQLWHGSGASLFDRVAVYSVASTILPLLALAVFLLQSPRRVTVIALVAVISIAGPPTLLAMHWSRRQSSECPSPIERLSYFPIIWTYIVARAVAWGRTRVRRLFDACGKLWT